ncbi:glycoside hydrolase family 9 protein [Photobacterium lipolyticum]|uniref:Chitobiase n=1 Tax=Photobacterium lipolyticum TaxID=266810 RepID=A0A2T3MWI5_9GAMM|nr:glycoside hydrolase family 9 protein [Photobacterium lipolyticum]PSW04259.1 chitobiase [Photobacterium lipolyticum]
MQLLTNHLGYERLGAKQAIVLAQPDLAVTTAQIICCDDGQSIMQLPLNACGPVAQWHTGYAYSIDFTPLEQSGEYRIQLGDTQSAPFYIAEGQLMQRTFSDLLHYFKSQRCSGSYEHADQHIRLFGSDETADVRGGWYDASGDVSKYLSHLSNGNYLNPQQTPMVVWNMLKAYEVLEDEESIADFTRQRLMEEALHGADFLLRMQNPQGYFYMTVFDKWSKSTGQREICSYSTQDGIKSDNYQAGFRQGGGVSIAALAAAARLPQFASASRLHTGTIPADAYLQAAEKGYWHLQEMNPHYLDNGQENIIDEYCALLATVELYRTTQQERYLEQARHWAQRLAARQVSDHQITHYWSANDDGSRPYFHAAEAGLPAIALMQYLAIEHDVIKSEHAYQVLLNALDFELNITTEVNNPFGYPRQYVKAVDDDKQTAFFMPHNNETGYWWQGENARIASLAAMAYMAQNIVDDTEVKTKLMTYGQRLTDWIVGLNPFDMCMVDGHGRNNPDYLPELGFSNAKGGVCNGITSGFENEQDIAFKPEKQKDDMLQNWRWGEQWIPHGGWYLLAITLQFKERYHG